MLGSLDVDGDVLGGRGNGNEMDYERHENMNGGFGCCINRFGSTADGMLEKSFLLIPCLGAQADLLCLSRGIAHVYTQIASIH